VSGEQQASADLLPGKDSGIHWFGGWVVLGADWTKWQTETCLYGPGIEPHSSCPSPYGLVTILTELHSSWKSWWLTEIHILWH